MKTILLATDGSPSAERATKEAVELAGLSAAKLHVLAVWGIPATAYVYSAPLVIPDVLAIERERAEETVRTAVRTAAVAGIAAEPVVRRGDPAEEICETASELSADLIVIGAHGWNPIRRVFLGSVSTRVLHHAQCPVLIARGDAHAQREREPATVVAAGVS